MDEVGVAEGSSGEFDEHDANGSNNPAAEFPNPSFLAPQSPPVAQPAAPEAVAANGNVGANANNAEPASNATVATPATPPEDPFELEERGKLREIGQLAVWSVSSCKPGFGVEQLRDSCMDTYWQSDGPQPHLVNVQFNKVVTLENIYIYADYKADESYTPSRISIRVGTHFHDLQEIEVIDLNEPSGWVKIKMKQPKPSSSKKKKKNKKKKTKKTGEAEDVVEEAEDDDESYEPLPLRTFMVQIAVLSNHQNGRDTHLRQVRIHAPKISRCKVLHPSLPEFTTNEFQRHLLFR